MSAFPRPPLPLCPGWNLINEPRCYRCGAALQRWAAEMASFVKSLDSNHLLTLGSEGFYPAGSPQVGCWQQRLAGWWEGEPEVTDRKARVCWPC